MVVELGHPDGKHTHGPGNPIKLSRTGDESFTPAPHVGQHTEEVLCGLLGYRLDEIEQLRAEGVIA